MAAISEAVHGPAATAVAQLRGPPKPGSWTAWRAVPLAPLRPLGGLTAKRSSITCSEAVQERANVQLNEEIAEFYDETSGVYEEIWGEHMHHGYYEPNAKERVHHEIAQVRMIDECLSWAGVPEDERKPKTVVDVGCGMGGSSRHMARKYGANVKGINLSSQQVQRATVLAGQQGLSQQVSFHVADAVDQPFADGAFDLNFSMECAEYIQDKKKLWSELARVTAPNGRIIIADWCHREFRPGETSLPEDEQKLVDKIGDAYQHPAWCCPTDYVKATEGLNLQDVKLADWSEYVMPFWPNVIRSSLTPKGLFKLAKAGWPTIKGTFAMGLMMQGYRKGVIRFFVVTARKPL